MSDVCVHGLGYIGLPTAAVFAHAGHQVFGYDTDDERVEQLRSGTFCTDESELQRLLETTRESGRLEVGNRIAEADFHVVTVPTPFDEETRTADLSYVKEATRAIGGHLRSDDTVLLESTVPPGTTETVVEPILEAETDASVKRFGLAYSPETVLPGDVVREMRENDRVVGGIDEQSVADARRLYDTITSGEVRTASHPTEAEFAKLMQNAYRDTNIALANEFAKLARDYGIDAREAIDLANEHPRVEIHRPGLGVGGHCLPIDPWFLGHDSDELDLIVNARELNDGMVEYTIDLLREELGDLSDRQIAVLGVAYKKDVADARQSPGLRLARTLHETTKSDSDSSADVRLHDPYVRDPSIHLRPLDETLDGADAAVVATGHSEYSVLDPERVRGLMDENLVVDTRAVLEQERWQDLGFEVVQL